jgi:hypothetical protein
MKQLWENESCHVGRNEMAGLKGKSGPPGNMNAFKHGLAAIQKRREESISTEREESVRQQNSRRLDSDKSGDDQISTVTRILAEVIAIRWSSGGQEGGDLADGIVDDAQQRVSFYREDRPLVSVDDFRQVDLYA